MTFRAPRATSSGQSTSAMRNKMRGLQRVALAVQLSEGGLTREEAASRLGLTKSGMIGLLRRHYGSIVWPIVAKRLD